MRVNSVFVVFLALALVQHQSNYLVNAFYTMSETCTYFHEGFVGDPTNCQNYGYCQNNKLLGTAQCPSGLSYDSYTATCKPTSEVECGLLLADRCKKLVGPQMIVDPNNCNKYCYCDNSKIVGCADCPTGQVFDGEQCVWPPEGRKCSSDSICGLVSNGQIVGDPDKCGGYLVCKEGVGVDLPCDPSTYFYNYNTNYCQSSLPSYCTGTPSTGAPSVGELCNTYSGTTIYVSDQQTCYGYYACTSATAGVYQTCPYGTHFDPDASGGQCVTPYEYSCPYDRCANLNATFMTVVNTDCKTYTYCPNGATDSCGAKNPYLNEFYGTCQATQPENAGTVYPVCSTS